MSRIRGLLLGVTLLGSVPGLAQVPVIQPSIVLRPSLAPEERARRAADQEQRREAVRRGLAVWRSRHEPVVAPLLRAVEEAVASLRASRSPYSANVGYAVKQEVERLRGRPLPPLPDPALQAEWDEALAEVEEGASLCLQRRLTLGQIRLTAGSQRLRQAMAGVPAATVFAPHRLFEQPPCGPGCAGTARPVSRRSASPRGRGGERAPLVVPKLPALRRRD